MGMPDIKKELETLYTGKATVYGTAYESTGHGARRIKHESDVVYEDIPCRLSYERTDANVQDRFGVIAQDILLFCDPVYTIKPGAKIVATQEGATHTYECAGLRAVYKSHQEIKLTAHRETA